MKIILKTAVICCVLLAGLAQAVEVPSQAIKAYKAGLKGDIQANARAIEQLGHLVEQYPADPLSSALLGSSETARARYVKLPWKKIRFSEKGLAKLDKSLELLSEEDAETAPGQLSVKDRVIIAAACTFVSVPSMFQRFDQGYEMLKQLIASSSFSEAVGYQQMPAYGCAARAAAQAGDVTEAEAHQAASRQRVQVESAKGQ